ncbi:cilia- and flagella-associated protein 77 [Patella vulgata]|uniref:cilia- and flagella-associated protein 77 n=1 Tax=Patella vulgata TaxID=6465 RepID=UPI0024A94F88|nr:cilia- and flagella-associated protein 77 [Patella vulgata]
MATSMLSPFTYTATGDLGIKRETMLQNELLLRTELGKPKRRGYGSGGGDMYFGRPNEKGTLGASEALRGWSSMNQNSTLPFHRKEKATERDFLELNKTAVNSGIVTSGENFAYRSINDIRRRTAGTEKNKTKIRRLPPSMVYGISTRPSTPIFDLLEHKYQDKWLQQRQQEELAKKKEKIKKNAGVVYETRASLLRTYQNPVESGPLWQLPRFKNSSKPHLQTFRTKSQEGDAFKQFDSDKIARQGNLGHGVYEAAKN